VTELADPAVLAAVEVAAQHQPDTEPGAGLHGRERRGPARVTEPLLPERLDPGVVVDENRHPGGRTQAAG
jgi:hypothetical protein